MSIQISKSKSIIISAALLLLVGIACYFFGFKNIVISFQFALDPYYNLIQIISNAWFLINGNNIVITGDSIRVNEAAIIPFEITIMFKKVFMAGLIIILLTKSKIWVKLSFGLILLLTHLLIVSAHNIYLITAKIEDIQTDTMGVFPRIALFLVVIILACWFFINRQRWEAPIKSLKRKLPDIIILLLTYIAVMLALEFLDFKLYIKFLLGSSKLVLMAFGYPVSISSNVLAGDYGSVSLAKSCLGLVTMYVFAAIIYISASNKTKALLYILVGIIILNLINILRIILLFVHLQKYGDYMLTMDSHDIYNYVIYGIIFILWVIWFEFYYSHKVKGNHIFSK